MALIVETGAIIAGAESYCTVAFADDYHAKRGNIAWDALDTTDQKEPALRKATDYMVQAYNSRWKGVKVSPSTQALDWPREEAIVDGEEVDGGIVPEAVKRACAELALKAVTTELSPDLTQGVTSETVGPISVTYDKNSPQGTRYRAIDNMLAPYLKAGGGAMVRLER